MYVAILRATYTDCIKLTHDGKARVCISDRPTDIPSTHIDETKIRRTEFR